MTRDEEVKELCEAVVNVIGIWQSNTNGPDTRTCPFCYKSISDNEMNAEMSDIRHNRNCAYLIAKSLLTNLQ